MARVMQALAIAGLVLFTLSVLALVATVAFAMSGYVWAACAIAIVASATAGVWAYRQTEHLTLATTPPANRLSNGATRPTSPADPSDSWA